MMTLAIRHMASAVLPLGGIPSEISRMGKEGLEKWSNGESEQQMTFHFWWQGEKPSSLLPLGVATSTLKASDGLILHQIQHLSQPGGFTKHDIFWWCLHALHYGHCSPPLSFEASTTSRSDEENEACSTLARLWRNPWAGGKQKDSRDKKKKGGINGGEWVRWRFWQKAEGREVRGPLLPPATLHHQAARDGWIDAHPNNRSDSDTEWNH